MEGMEERDDKEKHKANAEDAENKVRETSHGEQGMPGKR